MTDCDVILHRGNSIIQHGHFNNRVYLMKLDPSAVVDIIRYADELARREGYSKIFAKVPESASDEFTGAGYVTEATVPFFFKGTGPALFMAKYFDLGRSEVADAGVIAALQKNASGHTGKETFRTLPQEFSLARAGEGDAGDIAALYRQVFKTYPFPITDPGFVAESMQGHVRYFTVKNSRLLAAVASCEIDYENRNIEVTDFATDSRFRGLGFAANLLHAIEDEMKQEGICLAYTICRAMFPPINRVFASAGYQYGGLLHNNTNICGSIESMNVWYRKL